jgi:hypothetical protein
MRSRREWEGGVGVKKSCCHLFCFGAFDLTFNHNATMTTTVDLLPLFFFNLIVRLLLSF